MTENNKKEISNYVKSFQQIPLETRIQECVKIRRKYPNRVPIIVDRGTKESPVIAKNKYIVPIDISIGEFMQIIRKQISLKSSDGMYFFINTKIPIMSESIGQVYEREKNKDGYLYVEYNAENTFG